MIIIKQKNTFSFSYKFIWNPPRIPLSDKKASSSLPPPAATTASSSTTEEKKSFVEFTTIISPSPTEAGEKEREKKRMVASGPFTSFRESYAVAAPARRKLFLNFAKKSIFSKHFNGDWGSKFLSFFVLSIIIYSIQETPKTDKKIFLFGVVDPSNLLLKPRSQPTAAAAAAEWRWCRKGKGAYACSDIGLIEEEGEDLRTPAYPRFIPEQELWKGSRGKELWFHFKAVCRLQKYFLWNLVLNTPQIATVHWLCL